MVTIKTSELFDGHALLGLGLWRVVSLHHKVLVKYLVDLRFVYDGVITSGEKVDRWTIR